MLRLFLLLVKLSLGLAGAAVIAVALLSFVPPPTSAFMIEASIARGGLVEYDWSAEVSPDLLVAVVAAEDQRFAEHAGFDFDAIEEAAKHNRHGGSIRGASTISQQVAKNLFLWPGRSWLRKGIEAALTVTIEKLWTKRRILDVYVNIAEFGDGIFGAEAAARRFFGKPAASLSASESALLAAALPDPHDLRVDTPSPYMRRRQQWILRQMSAIGGEIFLRRLH
ncbi:MAG TPA: monofunctional biosynthetic peptidoglycan transglycosylase [Candidatus Limnocylindrales bacterium]|nr:monofunctional biosynthetic peptidoglycan transglycosylase [Candidatus Limnocylindrales bacterium]